MGSPSADLVALQVLAQRTLGAMPVSTSDPWCQTAATRSASSKDR